MIRWLTTTPETDDLIVVLYMRDRLKMSYVEIGRLFWGATPFQARRWYSTARILCRTG